MPGRGQDPQSVRDSQWNATVPEAPHGDAMSALGVEPQDHGSKDQAVHAPNLAGDRVNA